MAAAAAQISAVLAGATLARQIQILPLMICHFASTRPCRPSSLTRDWLQGPRPCLRMDSNPKL